ncbi:MAG TPA: hypothetical protein VK908_11990 [Jiangellales bacterium]|nr:hypothetical protein [Jiangellales bacterium]
MAVRLGEDDVLGWAAYAPAREEVRSAQRGDALPPPTPSMPVGTIATSTRSVVDALLELGELEQVRLGEQPSFTPVAAANRHVIDDPFAFLLAVIFDQGIVAERAWRAPYDLKQRLGHLDPATMAAQSAAVRVAINQQPRLHRFVERVPEWVVEAARIVVEQYAGDASRIWADQPSAAVLRRRLDAFPGIGQKKAAMAVEILERDLGVEVVEMRGSDIAYDVHVRRVFLGTGLAEQDYLDHMVDVARRAHPGRPGAIDAPAWTVGRRWCHAGLPDCPGCALAQICPKLVGRAAGVTGA